MDAWVEECLLLEMSHVSIIVMSTQADGWKENFPRVNQHTMNEGGRDEGMNGVFMVNTFSLGFWFPI
jgi:hypothetical protein